MTWDISDPPSVPSSKASLNPDDVLYYFDGPQIFKANFGYIEALCVKLEDLDDGYLWLSVQIDPNSYKLITDAKLSVRGAFSQENIWIVETNVSMEISRYWLRSLDDLDESMLPESGVAIDGKKGIPDHLEQVTSFFAFHFKGVGINNYDVQFSQFRSIVNNTYDATRRILAPISLAGSRSSVFDFKMKTAPGSLIIAVERPTFNLANIDRALLTQEGAASSIFSEFMKQRDSFFDEIDTLINLVKNNQYDTNSAEARFGILNLIHDIIPSGENALTSVTFTADGGLQFENVTIDEELGKVIHASYKELVRRPVRESGRIEIINAKSNSFVILSEQRHKQVTCYLDKDKFEELDEEEGFRHGSWVQVEGELKKRTRRDEMFVTVKPILKSVFD